MLTSASEDSEYSDVGPGIVESVAQMSRHRHRGWRRALRAVRDWTRSRYGLREIIFPEKYRVDARHELVVTYSSCLALIYFDDTSEQLTREDILGVPRRAYLYRALLAHPGIGLVATRSAEGVELESTRGRARDRARERTAARARRERIRSPPTARRAPWCARCAISFCSRTRETSCCSAPTMATTSCRSTTRWARTAAPVGIRSYPFIITPPDLDLSEDVIEDARDVHRVVMERYV